MGRKRRLASLPPPPSHCKRLSNKVGLVGGRLHRLIGTQRARRAVGQKFTNVGRILPAPPIRSEALHHQRSRSIRSRSTRHAAVNTVEGAMNSRGACSMKLRTSAGGRWQVSNRTSMTPSAASRTGWVLANRIRPTSADRQMRFPGSRGVWNAFSQISDACSMNGE